MGCHWSLTVREELTNIERTRRIYNVKISLIVVFAIAEHQ